jgi:hypothetical protein
MLTHADVCCHAGAERRARVPLDAPVYIHMLTYADACGRMRTYAAIQVRNDERAYLSMRLLTLSAAQVIFLFFSYFFFF